MPPPTGPPPPFTPQDPGYETRVRSSFARQTLMATLGARLTRVAPGEVDIELPFRAEFCQQHGFLHAGVVTAIVDTASGYAAYTLMPPDAAVLSVEFKINLLAPARGDLFLSRGRVVRAGRTLTVSSGEVSALAGGRETLIATLLGTMMTVRGRPGMAG